MPSPFRQHFPFFEEHNTNANRTRSNLVYLDSAATTQRLGKVISKTNSYYLEMNSNVHRGAYELAQDATNLYEHTRKMVAEFIQAGTPNEIVFTSGATESINTIANGLHKNMLCGDQILVCASEHHANLIPWQSLAKRFGLRLSIIQLSTLGKFTTKEYEQFEAQLNSNVALVAIAHASNALGNIYPIKALCAKAKEVGALSVIDGTQAAAHLNINVCELDCDFYVFSGHKMYAGMGVGILYGKYALLEAMQASKLGGEMVEWVSFEQYKAAPPPLKFEAGTPNVASIIGLNEAILFCQNNMHHIAAYEQDLYQYLLGKLQSIPEIIIWGNTGGEREPTLPILSFTLKHVHNQDLALYLGHKDIAVRSGHHCAMPLMNTLNISGTIRVSLACYNSYEDIDTFVSALELYINTEEQISLPKEPPDNVSRRLKSANAKPNVDKRESENPLLSDEKRREFAKIMENVANFEQQIHIAKSWNEKHRQLLLLSKHLPILIPELRQEANQVFGCESQVWVQSMATNSDTNIIYAYSDSKIIRGILALLIYFTYSQNYSSRESYEAYLDKLGLSKYFSQGRRDGISKVIDTLIAF